MVVRLGDTNVVIPTSEDEDVEFDLPQSKTGVTVIVIKNLSLNDIKTFVVEACRDGFITTPATTPEPGERGFCRLSKLVGIIEKIICWL